jgi:hypothetical protein
MFKENNYIQQSLFNRFELLPGYLKDKIKKSWAQTFRDKVFPLINENRFSVLYSDKASRPNSPVNVIIGLLILKDMHNLIDEELVGSIHFDFRYQYALGTENLEVQPISENTFTNFRNRLYDYEQKTGIDLLKEEVEAISKGFTDYLEIDGKKLRMDSLMVSSNCKKMSRLELVYTVIYNFIKELDKIDKTLIPEAYNIYLKTNYKKEFIYQIRNDAVDSKLSILLNQAYELYKYGLTNEKINILESFNLLARLVTEQINFKDNEAIEIKEGKEIGANSLQSVSDPDATFRKKYKNNVGYVANIVEAFDDQDENNTKSIITSYDFKQNTHSDIDFGREVIQDLIQELDSDKEIELLTDGAFFDQDLLDQAEEHNINMYFTNLVGRKSNPDKISCLEFKIDEEQDIIIECPNGVKPIRSGFSKGAFSAHFSKKDCENCPLFYQCLIKNQKKDNVVRFSKKAYKTEQLRKDMSTKEYKVKVSARAGVEGVPSALRRGYDVDHMPVRGLLRSKMHFGFKVLALNVKRLQKGLEYMKKTTKDNGLFHKINQNIMKIIHMIKLRKFKINFSA